jgi:hypothetical protein
MMHAGGHGFMKNSLLIWQASSSTGDYHNQMNFEKLQKKKWLLETLIPNLQPNYLVIDNAPYHMSSCSEHLGQTAERWI